MSGAAILMGFLIGKSFKFSLETSAVILITTSVLLLIFVVYKIREF